MIYTIASISSFLSGLGVGGGSIFILAAIMLKIGNLNELKTYNLLMFVSLGLTLAIKNLKELKKQKNNIKKIIIFVAIGSIIGAKISKIVPENNTKIIFNALMLALGMYEIIISLKNKISEQNINVKGEK